MNLVCIYCSLLIMPADDAQRIARWTFAHTSCAWIVNDTFFAVVDEMEATNAKKPDAVNLGFPLTVSLKETNCV